MFYFVAVLFIFLFYWLYKLASMILGDFEECNKLQKFGNSSNLEKKIPIEIRLILEFVVFFRFSSDIEENYEYDENKSGSF